MKQGDALKFSSSKKAETCGSVRTKRIAPEGCEQDDQNLNVQVINLVSV